MPQRNYYNKILKLKGKINKEDISYEYVYENFLMMVNGYHALYRNIL